MDFHQLLAKMQQLDQPTAESAPVEACGDPVGMPPPMNTPAQPPVAPPSMSVNLNAQGMDNIEDLMKLIMKVNPDMEKPSIPPMPGMSMPPSITSIKPELPPLKMLPDLDADNDEMPGGEKDHMEPDGDEPPMKDMMNKPDDGDDGVSKAQGDIDNDGDHDMDDHDAEKKKEKEEEYENEPEPEVKSSSIISGNDLHKEKGTYPKVSGGDNPMQKQRNESGDLRAQIRAELLQRLAEAKGAK